MILPRSSLRTSQSAAMLMSKRLISDDYRDRWSSSLWERPFQAPTPRDRLRLTQGDRRLVDNTSAPPQHTPPQSDPGKLRFSSDVIYFFWKCPEEYFSGFEGKDGHPRNKFMSRYIMDKSGYFNKIFIFIKVYLHWTQSFTFRLCQKRKIQNVWDVCTAVRIKSIPWRWVPVFLRSKPTIIWRCRLCTQHSLIASSYL